MKTKKILSLMLAFTILVLNVSLMAYSTEEEITKTATEFSGELESFLMDNSQYSSTVESPDGDESENDTIINTNRLIVSTYSNEPIENQFGAVGCLEGFNNWHILQYACEDDTTAAYEYYASQDYVDYVELDEIIKFEEEEASENIVETYSSDYESLSWGADRVESVSAINTLKKAKLGSQTIVAVIDSGVDASHSFFTDESSNVCRILNGNRPKDNAPDPNQSNYSHGTKVAGVIIDNTPSNVLIKPYNYYYYFNGTTVTLATEIESAVNDNVDVINMSLGDYIEKESVKKAVKAAIDKGIVVVASAGNDGVDAYNHYPSNYPDVISVAALNSSNKPWSNTSNGKKTNYGNSIDISAPGSLIKTTVPGGGYETDGGTSMAAPFVSAAAAILKSTNKNISPARICEILKLSAYKPSGWTSNYASNYGAGIVNYYNMLEYVTMPMPQITLGSNDKITITSVAGNNATYYYTTNGTEPTTGSTRYSGSFSVPSGAKSIKAIAVVDGAIKSSVAEFPIQNHIYVDNIYYKQKKSLDLPDDARNVKYSVDNKDIVVIEDGKVHALKTGQAIVTVTMNANRIYYYHINVGYAWWQHIIIYLFFGFLWYI